MTNGISERVNEQLRFYDLDELRSLSLEELQALWELVPTDRQKAYRAAYDREVRNAGAIGSDALEAQVAAALLDRYAESAVVPIGTRWARTPQRVQAAARENVALDGESADETVRKPSPVLVIVFIGLILLFAGLLLLRPRGNDAIVPAVTATPSPTPTVAISPTPTPLALEAQDDVITGGDAERSQAYPVNLQIRTHADATPRVWVVQRRDVRAAEWRFDPNPDVASFINGLSVRPVIGIPWSEDNAALFADLRAGASFTLTLNTGAVLRYEFAEKSEVLRSDTAAFRQVTPGLTLLLIGELDADGLPTATRTLITATYPAAQELSRLSALLPLSAPTETSPPDGELDVQVVSVTTQPGQLTTRLRIFNGQSEAVTFTQNDIWLTLGYAEDPPGPRIPAAEMQPFTLLPGQAVDLTLVWPWAGEPYGTLQVGSYRFAIQISR